MCMYSSDPFFTLADGFVDINNVGSMSQALYGFKNPQYNPIRASQWQATQVSTISLMNCAGRLFIGPYVLCAFASAL